LPIEKENLKKQMNTFKLGIDNHLLNKSQHSMLYKDLVSLFTMIKDFEFRSSYKKPMSTGVSHNLHSNPASWQTSQESELS